MTRNKHHEPADSKAGAPSPEDGESLSPFVPVEEALVPALEVYQPPPAIEASAEPLVTLELFIRNKRQLGNAFRVSALTHGKSRVIKKTRTEWESDYAAWLSKAR